jgi:hypothetical protein
MADLDRGIRQDNFSDLFGFSSDGNANSQKGEHAAFSRLRDFYKLKQFV